MEYFTLATMTLLGALASLFLKKSSGCPTLIHFIKNPYFYLGGILYGSAALLNIYILHYLDYSKVLSLTSITYVWTLFISKIFLKETIGLKKIAGVGLIVIGAIMVAM